VAEGGRESEGCRGAGTLGNGWAPRPRLSTGGPCGGELQEGTRANALTLEDMSPGLLKGGERAQREPAGRVHSLAHLSDVPALARAYHRPRAEAAVGVDRSTKEQYGQNRKANLQDRHARRKDKRYRHQPIRRVHIPKAQGKPRPIGISAFEDKVVQDAVREVLEAV
jgi:RNA-directed DNA polymerase